MLPDSDPDNDGDVHTANNGGGGRVPPASVLPPDHQLGMKVPKGGSMCANCEYLSGQQACGNQGFQAWNGSPQLPAPTDQYCCDLYEPGKQANQPQMMIKALQGGNEEGGRDQSPLSPTTPADSR